MSHSTSSCENSTLENFPKPIPRFMQWNSNHSLDAFKNDTRSSVINLRGRKHDNNLLKQRKSQNDHSENRFSVDEIKSTLLSLPSIVDTDELGRKLTTISSFTQCLIYFQYLFL